MTGPVLAALCMLTWMSPDEPRLTDAQKAELSQYFGFGPAQIYKIKPGITGLHLADLNGDGRTDIVLWNPYQSRFELFYQPAPAAGGEKGSAETPAPAGQSPADLERNEIPNRGNLRNENIPVNYKVAALEVGDVTGDGRPDIVFFGEPQELVILPGKEGGGFGPAESIRVPEGNPQHGGLCIGDFNHDGRADVALLGKDVLLVFYQKPTGGLAPPLRLVHGIENPMLMLRTDLNGDGRDDLIIGADDNRQGAYVCLQEPSGALAALRPVKVPRLRSITVAKPAPGAPPGDDLYAIEYATGCLKQYRWEMRSPARVAGDWPQRLHSYPTKSTSKRRLVALGDVDGDGLVDCLTADPDAAQLVLFKGEPDGLGPGTAFPNLVKATDVCIADLDLDGHNEVLTVSAEEKMIGVSRYEDGRLTFPTPLPTHGSPFVVAVGSLTAGGKADQLAYATRENDQFKLVIAPAQGGGPEKEYPLDELSDDPAGLRFVDVDQDGRNDLLLFIRFASPKCFLQKEDGTFAAFSGAETRSGLLKEAALAAFAVADVTADGKPEVLLAQGNLARALVVRDGHWEVVDQYNPETADAQITGLAALPGEPGSPTLVMYERKGRDLLVLKRREDHTYGIAQSMPVGNFDLTALLALPIGKAGKAGVLLADANKLALLVPDAEAATLVEKSTYESDTKDAFLGDAVVGDLNHDGVRDVVVVDMAKAALEILTSPPGGGFVKALRFQVFQGKRFANEPEGRGEPHEMLIGDVTGDGIDDIVLLVHDRLIIYPGQ